ncbi:MAG TPA: hypothetical protein PKA66_08790 [Gemmatimonadales bacterium]|nr:hypothetical protein [Gemmatimonadales bacterium]
MTRLAAVGTVALLIGLGCSETTAPRLPEEWGGPGATMTLGVSGGSAVYQCGTSTIDAGWHLAPGGRWHATGQYYPGGGPVPPEGRPPHPATYDGVFRGDVLTFSVAVPDLSLTLGPYTVTRGKPGASEICL